MKDQMEEEIYDNQGQPIEEGNRALRKSKRKPSKAITWYAILQKLSITSPTSFRQIEAIDHLI